MEYDRHDQRKNDRKTNILENNGFKCHLIKINFMCKHNNYVPSTSKNISILKDWDRKIKLPPIEVEVISSIEINYPMNIFDISNDNALKDWRSPAVFQQSLYDYSENGKPYAYYGNVQGDKNIRLYEHMFYGMKGNYILIIYNSIYYNFSG